MSGVNASLKRLDKLVGQWDIAITFRQDPSNVIRGSATFEWLGNGFVVQRSQVEHKDFPQGVALIGGEEATDTIFPMYYYDSRGISRLYHVTLDDKVLKIWRDDPEFSQRFVGTFSDDGNTITSYWEASRDGGMNWENDFDLTYTRVR